MFLKTIDRETSDGIQIHLILTITPPTSIPTSQPG